MGYRQQRRFCLFLILSLVLATSMIQVASAVTLIGGSTNNGNLDLTAAVEIVPGFFLPKPIIWQREAFRTITGPYEDEMSSEPWAGPAPTPVTTDGNMNLPHPEGCGGPDCAVFFKGFSGDMTTNGLATGHMFQDHPLVVGMPTYVLSGWAGAEANYSGLIPGTVTRTELAVEFLDAMNNVVGGSVMHLEANGLGSEMGEPFGYKLFTVSADAPLGAQSVRARVSMIDAFANPMGGGQALVVDDFTLSAVPEPATWGLGLVSLWCLASLVRRR